jgi:hypothetical protein
MKDGAHQYDHWQDVPRRVQVAYLELIAKDDGQLTELAARAAGIDLMPDGDGADGSRWVAQHVRLPDGQCVWNPLHNDAHAFRLAVQLSLLDGLERHASALAAEFDYDMDPYAATRRAIVRVAAALAS